MQLAGCATQVAAPPLVTSAKPAEFPEAYYQSIAARGSSVFQIDPARSLLVIVVRRGGSLTQFGHDHVIASHDVAGFIAPGEGRADLYVPLDALVVDESALRSEIGLDTQPSAADIAGTRRNMLEKVLETDRYPYATITVNDHSAGGSAQPLRVAIALHGTTRSIEAPVQFRSAGDEVAATGSLAIDQSQFGIAPFSILGGAIAVQNRVNITFQVVATRVR
jgi:YceI-like domain